MKSLKLLTLAVGLSSVGFVQAGESVVKWQDFDNYRDVRASNQSPNSFEKQITMNFDKHFAKLAKKLPSGYKLNVEVTDLDLAGDVEFSAAREVRVIEPIYYPRMKLSYTVTNQQGEVVSQSSEVSLKDRGFLDKIKRSSSRSFYYEKRLVTSWFNSEVLSTLS
ncbi:DUF3016 domain-containing protein [Pseudoalteromonas sp. MMG010]|uniref:DUF3016 domain-containing protein n=1 Tax=Pseudoalteromonas sp. MMG010 TaxID=2822685 RepID=UPI001B3A70B9|nr:DUF3016 domain-containing protein [Pseudoalteromonas sp. MMG010]MBQ4834241.1 DUF3016 domain-containing protein [Pseudoalteromonas sp. MMG010]